MIKKYIDDICEASKGRSGSIQIYKDKDGKYLVGYNYYLKGTDRGLTRAFKSANLEKALLSIKEYVEEEWEEESK